MEVDVCLEEFARVLVANGYINEDSCFNDADIPSMLNAFETPAVLESPDSYPVSACGYADLSRALEMAQLASQSLLDSCFSENLAHLKPPPCELYHVKSHNSYISHPVTGDPHSHITTSFKDSICSKGVFVNSFHDHQANQVSNSTNGNQNHIMTTCNTEGSRNLLPHSLAKPVEMNNDQLYLFHQNIPEFDVSSSERVQPHLSLSSELSPTNSVSPGHNSAEVLSSRPKQKRKRRNKGYVKATKSKKRKIKEFTEIKSQPKPKKQKVSKDNAQEQAFVKKGRDNAQEQAFVKAEKGTMEYREDVPQEDSGFESADGKMGIISGNNPVNGLADAFSSESPESLENSAGNKSLRRSSRTTRNPENYNFRLSSLVKRVETERRQVEPRQPKDKSKPPPLSKYRRRTANARERDRMKEINDAFDALRSSLPTIQRDDGKNKITKFTILKHALNYMASLRDLLGLEAIPSALDDDTSSDLSSIRPGSVASFGTEDSCSSPTSGHSMTNPISSNHVPSFLDAPLMHTQSPDTELTTRGICPLTL
ncbi:hypothetical protein BsWGS_15234 [Bradybaena similaris]